jgi:hypothetical protein
MRWFRIIAAVIAVGLLVGLGGTIFQTGYLAGAAASGTPAVVPVVGYGWGFAPFGFGGGIFHLLGTLFVVFLVLGLLRAALFGGRRHGHDRGPWGPHGSWAGPAGDGDRMGPWMDRAREVHEEWHRREATGSAASTGSPGTGPGGDGGTSAVA